LLGHGERKLKNELFDNQRENIVEEAKEESSEERNENNNNSEAHGLFACWPRDVRELAFGILYVVPESIHI